MSLSDDLLGFDDPPPQSERQRRADRILQSLVTKNKLDEPDISTVHISDVQHGVTIGTLSQIFRIDPTSVRRKLRDCAPISQRKAGHIYDLATASQFLVKPVFNVEQALRTMRVADLPTHLQEAFWSALRKKQQWEEEAGHLWRTEAVMDVFADVFRTLRIAIQLWVETVDQATGLSEAQRDIIVKLADALQLEIQGKLRVSLASKETKSTLSEAPPEQVVFLDHDDDYVAPEDAMDLV